MMESFNTIYLAGQLSLTEESPGAAGQRLQQAGDLHDERWPDGASPGVQEAELALPALPLLSHPPAQAGPHQTVLGAAGLGQQALLALPLQHLHLHLQQSECDPPSDQCQCQCQC